MMRISSTLTLLLPMCQSALLSGGRLSNVDHMLNIIQEVEDVTMNQPRRLETVVVSDCLDATDYFSWNRTNDGENMLRLHYDCSCSGDFGSSFTMHCLLENHCFGGEDENTTAIAQNTSLPFPEERKCISRSFTYDFIVDTETKEILDITRVVSSDVFESGFSFKGNFTSVNIGPCLQALMLTYDFESGDAIVLCSNRTTCDAFWRDTANYTDDQIDYICPMVTLDGMECQAFNLDECADYDSETDTVYKAMPDCSNINPCLTSSCQAYPRVDTTPERFLLRYPVCNGISIEDPTNDDTIAPTSAPIMGVPGDSTPTLEPTVLDVCSNAVEYLGTSEILKEYYECECSSGSSNSSLVLECSMEDYCFLDKNAASLEYCVNHNLTFTYSLNTTTNDILEITRAEACTDFLENGPKGRLCRTDWNVCRLTISNVLLGLGYDVLDVSSTAISTCLDRNSCISAVQTLLNYTQAEAEYFCPSVTLNGQECNSVGYDECGERDFDNSLFFRSMPDCSNVESCSTSTCQTATVRDPTPQRFMETFPQCGLPSSGSDDGGDEIPTNKPTVSPGNVSPGDTISASGAGRVFDSSYGSILLCAMTALVVRRW